MHFRRSNTDRKYTVNGRTLKSIDRQRDLGVQVHRSLKVATHVEKIVNRAYLPSSAEALSLKIGKSC